VLAEHGCTVDAAAVPVERDCTATATASSCSRTVAKVTQLSHGWGVDHAVLQGSIARTASGGS
jgi:hypothetical protein